MAKELPYFKFEPNQWENGNIQMVSREEKGLFIDLCCMYWSRLGDLPLKLAVQKLCLGDKSKFENLISENLIEIDNDFVIVKFLDTQISEFKVINNNRKIAGIKGGENRANTQKEARIKGSQLYVINCYDETESFIKIGITSESISRRFSGKLPYKYVVLFQHSIEDNLTLEKECNDAINKYSYNPLKKFHGYLECFQLQCVDELNSLLILRTSFAIAKQEIRNPIREDKTIGYKSKEEEEEEDNNTPTARFSFFKKLKENGAEENLANEWITVRKTKKLAQTKTAFEQFIVEVEKSGKNINEILKLCVVQSWGGFKNTWLKNLEEKEKSSAQKEKEDEPKLARMTISEAEKTFQNFANVKIPGVNNGRE